MDVDKAVKIAYAGNYAQVANTWKNFIGQSKMLKRNRVEDKKKEIENAFVAWYSKDPALQKKYGDVLGNLKHGYADLAKVSVPMYYSTMGGSQLGIIQIANRSSAISEAYEKKDKTGLANAIEAYRTTVPDLFKGKDPAIEKKQFAEILDLYLKNVAPDDQPQIFTEIRKQFGDDTKAYADYVYANSIFASEATLNKFLDKPSRKTLEKDPAWKFARSAVAPPELLAVAEVGCWIPMP